MKKRVVLGMSGGLDSSVAAYLLQKDGFKVIGITLRFSDASRCCSEEDACDARKVAQKLGIEHYTIDVTKSFSKEVIDYFIQEYKRGRTPNPCAVCNRKVKFKTLLQKAEELDAIFVATGHYARIQNKNNQYYLLKGKNSRKDQSYFLAKLKREWLEKIIFPVGEYDKKEVLKTAKRSNLPFYKKEESQEVCFIQGNDYRKFMIEKIPELQKPGNILDTEGSILGEHKGIFFYTIGQRKGIQVNINRPLYVISINPEENTITVGEEKNVYKRKFFAENSNWLIPAEKILSEVFVKIRSQHEPVEAKIEIKKDRVFVEFRKPQMAITPGQLSVFYKDDIVLGSGWIAKVS
ncbi:MAG: tRNA 2-thiouridine(34) synthase MnmA [Candidatus Cloacimonadota bacterium]|nr:MAG: tRNA 2-thiouridine(34) synthase MnmA [Candidatus Cloacimonadota bacterium]